MCDTYLVISDNPFNKVIHKCLTTKLGSIIRYTSEGLVKYSPSCSASYATFTAKPSLPLMVSPHSRHNFTH